MHEWTERMAGSLMTAEEDLAREFEARLVESATLAFRVAFSVLRQREDAEDVAQDAFARAHRRFAQLRDREKFRSWLIRIVWRLALDRRRTDRRRTTREVEHSDLHGASADESFVARERAELLWQAIDALPEKLRVATVLASIQGHDMNEVAALLGVPVGTVKSRLFLARKQLKERLQWIKSSTP